MERHSSATARQQTSHVNQTTRTATIMNALKQRAQTALNDESLDDQSRADADETSGGDSREKIEALANIICGAGDQSAAALFVLMGTMQDSNEPEALANTVKHFAFTRCGELNVFGIVDAQIAVVEGELLAGATQII
jgi:hypothetical protein